MSVQPRLNRLFASDGKCFDVAIDHGFFNEPSLVLRTDVANVYGKTLPEHVFSQLIADPVEQALRVDAACVVVNLFLLPGQSDLFHQCLANIAALKPQCERYGMPLMVEPLVM